MFFLRFLLVTVIALGTFLILNVTYAAAEDDSFVASPVPKEAVQGASTAATTEPTPAVFDAGLGTAVDSALIGSKGTYAVVIKDLKTGATYTHNADHSFDTASLYKLWVMAETYRQIADGKFTENTQMSDSVQSLNDAFDIASESAERTDGTVTFTVSQALEQMITISDNYAALLLTKQITLTRLSDFLKSSGFAESQVGSDPKTTASDMALFLEKLYQGKLGTRENTGKMLALLARQQINDRIPKYLPDNLRIMHKTGELYGVKHDVGIVQGAGDDYIIALLSDTDDPRAAAEREANISKNVYTYMKDHK